MLERIIKIPGKSFTDLSVNEVAHMIEADSSISANGNEYFSGCALDEFIHCARLDGRPDLEKIRSDILNNIYIDVQGSREKKINVEYLMRIFVTVNTQFCEA